MIGGEKDNRAPQGKYRVIGYALRDGQDYLIGDFDSVEAADASAKQHGGVGNPAHVYDDTGELIVRYGSRQ